jgi:predicted nuclease with TOPRIM domain
MSRKKLEAFAQDLVESDINAATAEFILTPPQQFSYDRKCREEGYTGTPQQFLEERRASNEALVKRLEQAEKDTQANQIEDLRETMEQRHGQLLVELKELRSEFRELRSEMRELVAVMARGRPQGEDDRGELIGTDMWDQPIYRKRDNA